MFRGCEKEKGLKEFLKFLMRKSFQQKRKITLITIQNYKDDELAFKNMLSTIIKIKKNGRQ